MEKEWVVYILECADGTYYTGITNDIENRVKLHDSGKGAKYTRTRGPVVLKYLERAENRADASRREYQIKKLTRKEKQELIEKHQDI